jgi:hypothetical protein
MQVKTADVHNVTLKTINNTFEFQLKYLLINKSNKLEMYMIEKREVKCSVNFFFNNNNHKDQILM